MKSKILEREKYILIKEWNKHKPCALFCAASISMLSTLSVNNSSQAQTISPHKQANKTSESLNLLQVPQSSIPSGRTKLKLKAVPPPPNVSNVRATLPSQKVEQYLPLENIKQLENSFIQEQITGKSKRAIEQSIAVERDAKSIGGPQTGIYEVRQLNAQAVPLPAPPGSSLEFTSPNFNAQATVAPLPPLPGTSPQQQSNTANAPTFNQLLNSRTSNQSLYPESVTASNAPTFEQMLDAYRREQPSVSVTSTPTFNTLLNSQGGMRPSAPLTPAPSMRSPSRSSQAPLVPQNNELNPLRSSA
ncbi:MAG: porin, partial [Rivularia sp. (in: cyanobacteria)]